MANILLVIPCYNVGKFITRCLDAVLNQTYNSFDVVCIDDASTDNTADLISGYPVRLIKNKKNRGLSAVRNIGLNHASVNHAGEYIAYLDADCVPNPDWLERLMENFMDGRAKGDNGHDRNANNGGSGHDRNSDMAANIAGVGGKLIEKYTTTLADKWRSVHMRQHWGDKRIINPLFLFGSNGVYRKDMLLKVGSFNEKYRTNYEDVDICKRIRSGGYNIVYEPGAAAFHLKRDSISSVLNTHWGWRYANRGPGRISTRLILNTLRSIKFMLEDIRDGNISMLPMDILLPFYLMKIEIERMK